MCSTRSLKPIIKRELAEADDDVVEILPRRAVTPNGDGFSVTIRDTNELTAVDVQRMKIFLKLPTVAPTKPGRFTLKEVRSGGWEINIEKTTTLAIAHMQAVIDIIASRESELQSRPQDEVVPRQRQHHVVPQDPVQPQQVQRPQPKPGTPGSQLAVNLTPVAQTFGAQQACAPNAPAKKRGRKPKDPNAPKGPLSAFFLWMKEYREQQKVNRPGLSIGEVSKAAGIAWTAMPDDEKQPWQERARDEKNRYDLEMAEYRQRNLDQP